jgi:hypothetical protein
MLGDAGTKRKVMQVLGVLKKEGFLARGNVECCLDCAWAEMYLRAAQRYDTSGVLARGCVFWHGGSDLEYDTTGRLYLHFGPAVDYDDPKDWAEETLQIGSLVCTRLREHGLTYAWDGEADACIEVVSPNAIH